MADKKPEGPVGWATGPAQGDHENDEHATDVEREAVEHSTPVTPNPGHGQGGAGH